MLNWSMERSVTQLVARFSAPEWRGALVEAWVFDDRAARMAAEAALQACGVTAHFRSAYKPLLHFMMEEGAGIMGAEVACPQHPAAPARRFLAETYPLAMLGRDVRFTTGSDEATYRVNWQEADGTRREAAVFAPNRITTTAGGQRVLTPCGWLRVSRDGAVLEDAPLLTDYEALFAAVMGCITGHGWGQAEPFFQQLVLEIDISAADQPLPFGHERISLAEALHEDLYFSILEFFQAHTGRGPGDRRLQPGQIVPRVRTVPGACRASVRIAPFASPGTGEAASVHPLAETDAPLDPARIAAELAALGGESFSGPTPGGRRVEGALFPGSGPGVLVTAAQHANETSGVVGLLRAAPDLIARRDITLGLIPVENPDGYALHQDLLRLTPGHMLHGARYTALGDDLEYRADLTQGETAVRHEGFRRTAVQLHINLHGYPAHEWTRPLSGYLPLGFEDWSVPRGFFLILRHHPGRAEWAAEFAEALAARLAEDPALAAFNARSLACYRSHGGVMPPVIHHGIPCFLSEKSDQIPPLTLITEFPDQTLSGPEFVLAQETQRRAILAAVDLFMGRSA